MNNEIMNRLLEMLPSNTGMELPPKVFKDMDGEFIEFIEGESLRIRFPNKERYMNPFGFMQGGIIVAAIDNTVSPLSYVLAPPSITKEITTSFKRPVTMSDRYIEVFASMLEKSDTHMVLQGEVRNEKGKVAAKGIVNCVIIKEKSKQYLLTRPFKSAPSSLKLSQRSVQLFTLLEGFQKILHCHAHARRDQRSVRVLQTHLDAAGWWVLSSSTSAMPTPPATRSALTSRVFKKIALLGESGNKSPVMH